ncbi:DUF2252 family protein [Mesorhizobium carmichaelinearum]|uniref:DUF2252 family protein n=1 Tax=Mesorhizobium carmichaelinearum TaxID=1208188 RepID=UPI0024536BDF|nr:DUF2252 family protein [Mesorhizobium carmichaelinearum]
MNFKDRKGYLERVRNRKMAQSPHAYVRGSVIRFYEWLGRNGSALPQGPAIWICGDCHLGNLGALADLEGNVDIQIRDFDQTVIGNPAHDLVRLGLSLASAIRSSDLPGVTTARMLVQLLVGYVSASRGPDKGRDSQTKPKTLRSLIQHAVRRRWHALAMERLETMSAVLPRSKRFWPLHRGERHQVLTFVQSTDVSRLSPDVDKARRGKLKVLDAAYWIKGCSSLGHLRYAALVQGRHSRMALLDLKEATTAVAPSSPDATMPRGHAERVIAGARALSPHLGERMLSGTVMGRPVFVREVTPQDLKLEIDRLNSMQIEAIARHLGGIVGKAHRRQMDAGTWRLWTKELLRSDGSEMDTPSWLWASVIDLLADHEVAYLEHCRRFALDKREVSVR